MKDKELKLEESEPSHTLGGVINTLKYINLTGVSIGLVELRGPMHRSVCVRENDGEGKGTGSYT